MNVLIAPFPIGFMESLARPSGASAKKEKKKKNAKASRGKEDKNQMKYKFWVEITSKVSTEWDTVTDTNLGQVDLDEFRQRLIANLTTKNAKRIRKSGLAKAVGFLPTLVAPKLVMAYREAYQEKTKRIIDLNGRLLANLSSKSIGKTFHIPTFDLMEEATKE